MEGILWEHAEEVQESLNSLMASGYTDEEILAFVQECLPALRAAFNEEVGLSEEDEED